MNNLKITLSVLLVFGLTALSAKERPVVKNGKKSALKAMAESCAPATAQTDLNINNVRARILGGGDMWWDLNNAQYEVPKGSNLHSMFAGALWLGGIDEAEQLKLAAMTYRTSGVDYWPGPLSEDASVTEETCQEYDRHWLIYRSEVETHKAWIDCKEDPTCNVEERFPGYAGNIPTVIQEWPGNGINGELANKLAPFTESDTNGIPGYYEYEWDYPGYDLGRTLDCQDRENDILYGDQTIWWVYNDRGNVHTETQGAALGFEIRAQAFAFTSNDEINNMTFNNYRILNKSSFRLADTYFGTWFDPDVGNYNDDIIGCDIARGLGYCYNGDDVDEGANGYGSNPPAIGFDFFQGPFADYFNKKDDDRDGCVDGVRNDNGDCVGEDPSQGINERIIMSGFMYYNNGSSNPGTPSQEDPDNAEQFYNFLQSFWKFGEPLVIENPSGQGSTANGDGYVSDPTGFTQTKYAYPGRSYDTTGANLPDAELPNGGWFESPDVQADKRGLHSAGPFALEPGALNFITTGTVWARNFSESSPFGSVEDVIIADDKAQQLFDNCFQVLDGPDAPNIEIVELDRELIINFVNPFDEAVMGYSQEDPLIAGDPTWSQEELIEARENNYFNYVFEGFQIFQVENADVGVDQLYNTQFSRLIAQSDLKNDITQLVNYTESPDLLGNPLTPMDMTLEANNQGVEVSYRITEDAFAEGDRQLVNHKEYYFYVLAYAQNDFITFDPLNMSDAENAQKEPYLASRRNIGDGSKPYLAIPSKVESRDNGTGLNANWGDLISVTRLNGVGNGGAYLRIAQESEDAIVQNFYYNEIKYLDGFSPVEVKVVDPYKVKNGEYRLEYEGIEASDNWNLYDLTKDSLIATSSSGVDYDGEQIIEDYGFSITTGNPVSPGYNKDGSVNNGVLGASITFEDPSLAWLSGIPDTDGENPTNWILAGPNVVRDGDNTPGAYYADYTSGADVNVDINGVFETLLGGTVAPVSLVSNVPPLGQGSGDDSPGFPLRDGNNFDRMYPIDELPSVDVVITSDPSKWSRVPVLEMGNISDINQGNGELFRLREANSLNLQNGELVEDPSSTGWSYFPGYAIDVETGKRLNLMIGESSYLVGENGADMLWNPTANLVDKLGFNYVMAGMHVVYVVADSATVLDENFTEQDLDLSYKGDRIEDYPLYEQFDLLNLGINREYFWGTLTWCSLGMLTSDAFRFTDYSQIPTDVKIELRVDNPIGKEDVDLMNNGNPVYEFEIEGKTAVTNDLSIASSALDNIRVVPNPYYGSSDYEDGQLDNIVKITNLPPTCEINIFMTNGTLVRNISKDNSLTYAEWDLKNDFNVPIAGGVYIIHIDAGPIGEKVVKWMGSLRPVDLNAF